MASSFCMHVLTMAPHSAAQRHATLSLPWLPTPASGLRELLDNFKKTQPVARTPLRCVPAEPTRMICKLRSGASGANQSLGKRDSRFAGKAVSKSRSLGASRPRSRPVRRSAASGAVKTSVFKRINKFKERTASTARVSGGAASGANVGNGTTRPQLQVGSLATIDRCFVAGDAREDDAAHKQRHRSKDLDNWAQTCSRCAFEKWSKRYTPPPWLKTKPNWMSGAWGVGCGWCAAGKVSEAVASRRHALIAENKAVGVAKQAASRFSTWSRYDAKKCLNAQNFARSMLMHERTDLHRIAAAVFHSPEAHLHQITWNPLPQPSLPLTAGSVTEKSTKHALQTSMSQAVSDAVARNFQVGSVLDPFRGCVPQEQDWIDLRAHSSSCISMLKQARVAGKKKNLVTQNATRAGK